MRDASLRERREAWSLDEDQALSSAFFFKVEGVQGTQTLFQTEHSSRLGRDNGTEDLAWRQLCVHRLELGAFLDKPRHDVVFQFR